MKKIGTYTARGRITADNTYYRVNVFDGDYTTGYKITRIAISPYDIDNTGIAHYCAKVITQEDGTNAEVWDWGDNLEVAWAYYAQDANGIFPLTFNEVDRDNLIIEDCYIVADEVASSTGRDMNYIIEFEKYQLEPMRGSLAIVQNRSQG